MRTTLSPLSTTTNAVLNDNGSELGRVRWDGRSYDASKLMTEEVEVYYLLRGTYSTVEAAVMAVVR
jgi:hypothetical protein